MNDFPPEVLRALESLNRVEDDSQHLRRQLGQAAAGQATDQTLLDLETRLLASVKTARRDLFAARRVLRAEAAARAE